MRFEDLPPAIRKAIRSGHAVTTNPQRAAVLFPAPSSPTRPPQPKHRQNWRCHDCGETFTQWAPAQRHANENGHVRIELVLPGEQ